MKKGRQVKLGYVQKKILTTIYLNGKCEEVLAIAELKPDKVDIGYQLHKQQIVNERNGVFTSSSHDMDIEFKNYKITAYKIKRTDLSRLLYHWKNLNAYGQPSSSPRLLRKPEYYDCKQVTISNALKRLELNGFIESRNTYDMNLNMPGISKRKIIWLTTKAIQTVEKELLNY